MHGVLWGLKERYLTQPGRSRGFLEKKVHLEGQAGIKRQRRGMVDILGEELKLT